MDSHITALALILFVTLSGYLAEEHLVPKHGLESRHQITRRDLSQADMEMILKALMVKLEHKEPEMPGKVSYAEMKEITPYEADGYEMKKTMDAEEKEMKAFSMKLKDLGIGKNIEETYGKEAYFAAPEEKLIPEKEHLLKGPVLKDQSRKVFGDVLKDKFNDKEVSMAESLYHMKIAGDVETYPHLKMEPLHEMKMLNEKLHFEKNGGQEAFLKKVDELGKTLLKEEHLKEGDIEEYLKKIAEEEKYHLYVPEITHTASHIKGLEEKAADTFKTNHKDIFDADEKYLDEKLKIEAAHLKGDGTTIGLNDELIKKIKTFNEELSKDHDELIHTLSGKSYKDEIIADGTTAYEIAKEQAHKDAHIHLSDEEIKKHIDEALAFGAKGKGFSTDMLFGKGLTEEKVSGIDGKIATGLDKAFHSITDEKEKAFKSKEIHASDKAKGFEIEKSMFDGKIPLMEDEFKHAHKIAGQAEKAFNMQGEEHLKKEISHGTDALLHKFYNDELLKKEKASGADDFLYKAFKDELIKKGEAFGKDEFLHKAHEEDLLKGKVSEGFLHKTSEEELLKKEKAFGADAFLHKAHEGELLKKEKAFDADSFLHKAHEEELLKKEKAFDADAFLHKAHGDELLKEKAFDADAFLHKTHGDELLKDKSFGVDTGIHKTLQDEIIKKEIAYGTDALFHKDKGIVAPADKQHEAHEKSHKTIHDLKAKFFELLRRVLRTRKCHLVTMRPVELLGIVNCVSRSKDPLLCEKFAMCEKKMPPRVIEALEKCQKETIPGGVKTCTKYAPLFTSTEIPLKIFQCVAVSIRELMPEEKKMMIEFEECARVVKAESCARFKFLPH